MKGILYCLTILLIIFLVSCSTTTDDFSKNFPELVPQNDDEYLLYSIEDEITFEQLENENIHIYGINNRSSFDDFNEMYPELDLEQSPAYILFDKDGLNYKTYNYDELIQYLKENPQP